MAFIANNTSTVGEVVDYSAEFLLNGLFRERKPGKGVRQSDIVANRAARKAIQEFAKFLNEVYTADADTLLAAVPVPTGTPKVTEV